MVLWRDGGEVWDPKHIPSYLAIMMTLKTTLMYFFFVLLVHLSIHFLRISFVNTAVLLHVDLFCSSYITFSFLAFK